MKITIPDFSLVVLVGPTGAGKSTFGEKHFLETEIVSSDRCRGLVSDDVTDQSATDDAFALLHYTAGLRLKRRKLTVIDSTAVRREDRSNVVKLARVHHALPIALVFDIDPSTCNERNRARGRRLGAHVARNQSWQLRKGLRGLRREGFGSVYVMKSPEDAEAAELAREPLWTDRRRDHGPFDIIGDVHGCFDELAALLERLGYRIDPFEVGSERLIRARHPEGRKAVFVGDLTDRGPRNVDSLRLVAGICEDGNGLCVMGNHDFKLSRWLRGNKVQVTNGLDLTAAELERTSKAFRRRILAFLGTMRSHYWLAGGRLVIAHAGLKEEMHGRASRAMREFSLFGETTGETDEQGLPVRLEWARDYRGRAEVIFGHTPVAKAEWLNRTLCIDTGCVIGGELTAYRWPEREVVAVPAARQYAVPAKPPVSRGGRSAQQEHDELLYFDDYTGKRRIGTRFGRTITIPAENSLAALETLSRFGIDPRWLIYLPPTMSPPAGAPEGPFLEHPEQAFKYFKTLGICDLVAEEKHMGSRALLVVAKDAATARSRFGAEDGKSGVVYTRTGRSFFRSDSDEAEVVARVGAAMDSSGLWDDLATGWVLLDAEVMPWSAKAGQLLGSQYRPTVAGARSSAEALIEAIGRTVGAVDLDPLRESAERQLANATQMGIALEGYCWDAETIDDYRIAPFHLLAAEEQVFIDKPHTWHMDTISRIADTQPILQSTVWRRVNVDEEADRKAVVEWWLEHTGRGGEGIVVKPSEWTLRRPGTFVQPALKVRGREYLRIIYGPDYCEPRHLERLRHRTLGHKRSKAARETQLGFEGLYRFVESQPLAKVHECVHGVLALESEPVDPRL
ncbi:MAG: polynucleotide kinase-phosphatase [Bryobacterales bacterium]|nr:polynucleotide kinase-phosphatase [Bryobacterales bacterium]